MLRRTWTTTSPLTSWARRTSPEYSNLETSSNTAAPVHFGYSGSQDHACAREGQPGAVIGCGRSSRDNAVFEVQGRLADTPEWHSRRCTRGQTIDAEEVVDDGGGSGCCLRLLKSQAGHLPFLAGPEHFSQTCKYTYVPLVQNSTK